MEGGTAVMAGEYIQKLKDPRWQRKRLEILERDEFRCQSCGDETATLHVHHLRYAISAEPWECPEAWLLTLCEKCHEQESTDVKPAVKDLADAIKETFLSCDIRRITFMVRFLGNDSFHALLDGCRKRRNANSADASEEHF